MFWTGSPPVFLVVVFSIFVAFIAPTTEASNQGENLFLYFFIHCFKCFYFAPDLIIICHAVYMNYSQNMNSMHTDCFLLIPP